MARISFMPSAGSRSATARTAPAAHARTEALGSRMSRSTVTRNRGMQEASSTMSLRIASAALPRAVSMPTSSSCHAVVAGSSCSVASQWSMRTASFGSGSLMLPSTSAMDRPQGPRDSTKAL